MNKLFQMTNQEFKALGRKYQVLPNFGICSKELGRFKVTSFRACVRSFCSVSNYLTCNESKFTDTLIPFKNEPMFFIL